MHEQHDREDHSVFKKHYSNDPFRNDNFVFFEDDQPKLNESGQKKTKGDTFKINPNTSNKEKETPHGIKSKINDKLSQNVPEKQPEAKQITKSPAKKDKVEHTLDTVDDIFGAYTSSGPKRSVFGVLKSTGKQILVYALSLVIIIFALNASAYYKIIKNEFEKFFGLKEESPLMELIEDQDEEPLVAQQQTPASTKTVKSLPTSVSSTERSKFIPPLDIDISPVDNRLVIPRIDQNIPIVRVSSENLIKRDWGGLEHDLQEALKNGVVHYPGTSLPGQDGNVVITGHSSYFPWDPGRFKDVFALLHDVVVGDKILIYYDQKKYLYEINEIKVVLPQDIKVLQQTEDDQVTLITCTPVGTNLKRLIVTGRLIDPEAKKEEEEATKVLRT